VLHAKRSHHRGPISAAKAAALDGSSFVNSSFQGEDAEQQQERSTR